MPNKQNKLINIGTPKRNCVTPTWQYGITKYAESSILTTLADANRTSVTNTYCCVYSVESFLTTDSGPV